ncbi:gametocyte-specific factor 1 isoform X1 [Oryzias latipes]|uniref:gametocyte-specific factor 1 isoform X1 n=1 Tax=Oryzias latipes TaxID=8090 RepID=UPI0002A48366|nr:gametocyte-specific factor 1 isoform X1 [Oryzias latipes]XP_020560518.1 gametocyte-specific factor 1 isoform X1 [Oryzias latipes]XP_020560519.1 gametocyte-specific factor 1 isoform X1 [Oryzias latipes]
METTNTFGSARTVVEEREQLSAENDEKGNSDPEKLLLCPFDKNHLIRTCRFPYHLIKCRKNHPKLAAELKTCPFNACHLIPPHELAHHTETCAHRVTVDPKVTSTDDCTGWEVPITAWVNPDMTEDWDKEIEDKGIAFVWGADLVLRQMKEANPSKHFDLKFGATNTLPWDSSNH